MSMSIHEIKIAVEAMLETAYKPATKKDTPKLESVSFKQLETEGFVREQDAEAISTQCKSNNIFVSFRAAGADTLQRIKEGHPCKGHDITDKSIKATKGAWTYIAPVNSKLGSDEDAIFNVLKGFVGCPYIPLKSDYSVDYSTANRKPEVSWKEGKIDRVVFHLNEVYALPVSSDPKVKSSCSYTKLSAMTLDLKDLVNAYTGDYDMHDLIHKGTRPLATTPEEMTVIDMLNKAILGKDKLRKDKVVSDKERIHTSPYALIRHGAQTSFLDFLTTGKGEADLRNEMLKIKETLINEGHASTLPFGNSVIKIDDNIAMFDNTGKAFILKGVGQIYNYYKNNKLEIPFYNFFNALSSYPDYKNEIGAYSEYINRILLTNLKLIKHTEQNLWQH